MQDPKDNIFQQKKFLPLLGSKLYGKPPMCAGGGLPKGSPYNIGERGDPVERT